MFILGGYIFDKRLRYSFTVWTSAGAASIVIAGNIGWQFNKAVTLMAGYTGVPGSRSMVNTFPYFTGTDRSMADNFFRPDFTQGVWATGTPVKNLNYIAFLGNGLNTLNISAAKIDTNLLASGSVWWEPLGVTASLVNHEICTTIITPLKRPTFELVQRLQGRGKIVFQISTNKSGEHVAIQFRRCSYFFDRSVCAGCDGRQSYLPHVGYRWGLKWNGLAVNGQYFFRWLNNFEADGPLPLTSTFDHGYELSAGYFVVPKRVMVYGRGSGVFGQFGNSYEYAGGVKWHFLRTERLWLNGELMRVNKVPYNGAFTQYTSGLTGWVPMIQTVIAF
jgi:hypothetical protein